jgi:hypothetical protein
MSARSGHSISTILDYLTHTHIHYTNTVCLSNTIPSSTHPINSTNSIDTDTGSSSSSNHLIYPSIHPSTHPPTHSIRQYPQVSNMKLQSLGLSRATANIMIMPRSLCPPVTSRAAITATCASTTIQESRRRFGSSFSLMGLTPGQSQSGLSLTSAATGLVGRRGPLVVASTDLNITK